MHLVCLQDAFETCPERAQDVYTSMQVQNLVIKLQQDLCNCHFLFHQMQDVSRMHPERVQDKSGTHANVILELSCTILSTIKLSTWRDGKGR